jgi:hypothetical protein
MMSPSPATAGTLEFCQPKEQEQNQPHGFLLFSLKNGNNCENVIEIQSK